MSDAMAARQRQIMEDYVARLEYQLAKALERCEIAEEKLTHVARLVRHGLEHPPSRYMSIDASGSAQQQPPPMPQYIPSRSAENTKRPIPVQNNQIVHTQTQTQMQLQTPHNTHIFFDD
jgi:hypothetical protein